MTTDRRRTDDAADAPPDADPSPITRANTWTDAPRMAELRHVHGDHDPRSWHWFARGPTVAADGGRRDDPPRRRIEDEQLRDVSHAAADGQSANGVWRRGDRPHADPAEDPE